MFQQHTEETLGQEGGLVTKLFNARLPQPEIGMVHPVTMLRGTGGSILTYNQFNLLRAMEGRAFITTDIFPWDHGIY